MNNLIRETLREVSHEGPAIPFSVLVARLRSRGVAITEAVLVRTLEGPGSGALILDPWCGPHASLRKLIPAGAPDAGPWVVPQGDDGDDPDPDPSGPACLRRSLRLLAGELDTRSPRDLARWVALVEEARRLRPAA